MTVCVRFDYEGLEPRAAFYMMRDLESVILDKAFSSQKFAVGDHMYNVERTDNFEYIDPVDGTVVRNQVSVDYVILEMTVMFFKKKNPKQTKKSLALLTVKGEFAIKKIEKTLFTSYVKIV